MDAELSVATIERERQPGDSVRIVLFSIQEPTKFLVVAESDDPENLKLPGGKFEPSDVDEDACADREQREELGLGSEETDLRFARELSNEDGVSRRYVYFGFVDASKVTESEERGISTALWVETAPEGKNQGHISSAVAAALQSVADNSAA